MPFTLSHIIFSVPLKKLFSGLSITGLIIGSILPDIEYYLRMTMYGTWGNTIKGIALYEIPIGIFIGFCYHLLVRDLLILHLPDFVTRRWSYILTFNWLAYFKNNSLLFLLSLILGIGTHLFWDLLTHDTGYVFGLSFAFLSQEIYGAALYDWNQMILSIIGLILLFVLMLKGGKVSSTSYLKITPLAKIKYWAFVFGLGSLIYTLRVLWGVPSEKIIIQHIVFINSAFFLSIILVSILFKTPFINKIQYE